MKFIFVIIISVVIGTFFSPFISEVNRSILDVFLFNCFVSLCALWLVKWFIYMKPKQLEIYNSIERFFSNNDDLTVEEKEELSKLPSENMFGLPTLILGGVGFLFGPQLLFVPIIALLFGILTFGTLDKSRGQNPWAFYIGITFSIIGIVLHELGYTHILN